MKVSKNLGDESKLKGSQVVGFKEKQLPSAVVPVCILLTEITTKFSFGSLGDGSVGKRFAEQAWGPEFNP